MVLIDDIRFSRSVAYADNTIVQVAYDGVDIGYRVMVDGNEITGKLTIDFSEFEDMNFNDITKKVKEHFNKTVKEI